jgi:membrane fusion protein (multidrug efflux system)
VFDGHAFELELIAPSRWLGWLRVKVEEIGTAYPVRVTRLGGQVDPSAPLIGTI